MRTLLPSLSLFALFTLFACGGNQTDEASQESTHSPTPSANDFSDAIEQVQSQAAQLQEGEPLPFRELQEILPKQLNGLERTSKSGQTNGAMGFKISQAEAKYQTNEGESIEVEIFDTGGLKMGLMSMAAWASLEMDKEDDNGYERTSTIQGFRASGLLRNTTKEAKDVNFPSW